MDFRKLHHALGMRRSTSMDRSALYIHLARCLYAECGGGLHPYARKRMISVFASNTERPNAAHTTTSPPSSSSAARVITRRPRHRHRKAYHKAASRGLTLRQSLSPSHPFLPRVHQSVTSRHFFCVLPVAVFNVPDTSL